MTDPVSRRGFLRAAVGIVAAPALVRVASLMPVSVPRIAPLLGLAPLKIEGMAVDFDTAALRYVDHERFGEAFIQMMHAYPLDTHKH